ncbi:MAG: DUF86 domain-containing protein, partial [Desulfovibrionaceae bacterium]
ILMQKEVVQLKLTSLLRCVQRVQDKVPASSKELAADYDLQDIVVLNIQRAIQISVDIATHLLADTTSTPGTMAEAFLLLHREGILTESTAQKMARSVGLRNIAVHEYTDPDWGIVHSVAGEHMDDFRDFGNEILDFLNKG